MTRRRFCWVASLIRSTNSGLSAMAGSLAKGTLSCAGNSARNCLTTSFAGGSILKGRGLPPLPDIDKVPRDCRCRRHGRRYQMGAALKALAALEIAVRGRGAALFGVELVGIHRQTHRAARLAPVESGFDEDLVEAFGFRLFLHEPRARHDHRIDVG